MKRFLFRSLAAPALLTAFVLGCALAHADDGLGAAESGDNAEAGFVPIFDGETLDGWTSVGGNATYEVVDGVIVGSGDRINQNTFLRTEATYADFEFRCQFKFVRHSNSGIQFRSRQRPNDAGEEVGRVYGYQCELDPSPRAWTAGLYEEGRRGWLQNVEGDDNAHKRDALNLDDWNDIAIRCEGGHIQTWLNGVLVTDFIDEADEALLEGFIALQVHSGQDAEIHWRDLRVKVLDEGEGDDGDEE
ncbi:MAG: DUF1080 domain-containing protein [Planctomycetota bacterium]